MTFLQTTPSAMRQFDLNFIRRLLRDLSLLVFGGEPFPAMQVLKSWLAYCPWEARPRVINLYGITEVSSWASWYEISESDLK